MPNKLPSSKTMRIAMRVAQAAMAISVLIDLGTFYRTHHLWGPIWFLMGFTVATFMWSLLMEKARDAHRALIEVCEKQQAANGRLLGLLSRIDILRSAISHTDQAGN